MTLIYVAQTIYYHVNFIRVCTNNECLEVLNIAYIVYNSSYIILLT